MKKLIVLVCAVVFLFGVIGIAQAHSNWAKYKENPVPYDVNVPKPAINTDDGTLNCCFCHGRIPSIPPMGCR